MLKAKVTVKNVGGSSATIRVNAQVCDYYACVIGGVPYDITEEECAARGGTWYLLPENIPADPSRGDCTNCPQEITLYKGNSLTVTIETNNTIDRIFCIDTFFKGSWLVDDSTDVTVKGACYTDADCLPKYGRKGKCENNICKWGPCQSRDQCDAGYCCEAEVGSITLSQYGCVKQGTIKDSKYLCDPPGWANKQNRNSLIEKIWQFLLSLIKY